MSIIVKKFQSNLFFCFKIIIILLVKKQFWNCKRFLNWDTLKYQILGQYVDKSGHSWGGSFFLISFWWRSLRLRESTNILHLYFSLRPMKLIQISVTERFRVSDYTLLKDLRTFSCNRKHVWYILNKIGYSIPIYTYRFNICIIWF